MSEPTLLQTARDALVASMTEDEHVLVLGEDVAAGGPFGLTKGLVDSFGGDRVRNTPISEGAVMGVSIGLALGGKRPFVDLMFNDFLTAASDQLFNHAAKIHYMSGGRFSVPLTVWTIAGAGTRWGAHHSQHLDGWLAQVPGLKVLCPSTPTAAARAVDAAVAHPDPVVVLADRALLYSRAELSANGDGSPWRARLVRSGDAATIAASGRLVHLAIDAAEETGVAADVVDLQCLAPLDVRAVIDSVGRTARLLLLHDEAAPGPMASMVHAAVHDATFWRLEVPIRRLTSPASPVPASPGLEDAYMLGVDDVAGALQELVDA